MRVAFAVLSLLDILTTLYVGFEFEMNPVVISLGVTRWIVVKALLVVWFAISSPLCTYLWPVLGHLYQRTAVGIGIITVAWNIRALLLM